MNTGDIDRLETEAEKAITQLAELAIEHNKDAIEWRRRYGELVKNLSNLCLYDRDVAHHQDSGPFLVNYADGVKGHFCIARNNDNGFREYFNIKENKWCSAGTLLIISD